MGDVVVQVHALRTTRTAGAGGRWVYLASCSCRQWSSGFVVDAVTAHLRHRAHRLEERGRRG